MISKILSVLYPAKCPFCRRILFNEEEGICTKCRQELPYINEPRCMKCGKPIQDERKEYCYDCGNKEHFFEEGRSLWVHKSPVDEAVYRFKYQDLRCYGDVFGTEIANEFKEYIAEKRIESIIPIPLSKKRYKSRGYNQAEILAKKISEITDIPICTILERKRETNPQKILNDHERRQNIRGAFVVREKPKEKRILLIDDIYTTGSTLDEAAKTLKLAGVSKVFFLTISIGQGF